MELTLTAHGQISKSKLIKDLRSRGYKISYNRAIFVERHDDYTIDLARRRLLTCEHYRQPRKVRGAKDYQPRLRVLTQERFLASLNVRQLERGCFRASGVTLADYRAAGGECVDEILRRVGAAGEQARADETRYFETYDNDQYSSNSHAGRDWREVSFASIARDFSRAIICYADVGSFLHKAVGEGGLHHLRFETYLIVRDSTSGDRHVLRIPPRFGRYTSATVSRFAPRWYLPNCEQLNGWCRTTLIQHGEEGWYRLDDLDSDNLTHAAVAWTFDLDPRDYRPQMTA